MGVYIGSARSIVHDFTDGRSGCLICYGQTGSGKTHTIFGRESADAYRGVHGSGEALKDDGSGIAPRVLSETIAALEQKRLHGMDAYLGLSFVEMRKDGRVFDLLSHEPVGDWKGVAAQAVQRGYAERKVESEEQVQKLIQQGQSAKSIASTHMNDASTRAHTVLQLRFRQRAPAGRRNKNDETQSSTGREVKKQEHEGDLDSADCGWAESVLSLVDLGGSERVGQSKVCREHLSEAIGINTSLLALKRCMRKLSEVSSESAEDTGNIVSAPPYKDSKLTTLLKDALGHSANAMVMVSAHDGLSTETMSTCSFGEECKHAQPGTSATDPSSESTRLGRVVEGEMRRLEREIQRNEVWRGGAPTGAEQLRERYEELLSRYNSLVGAERGRDSEATCNKYRTLAHEGRSSMDARRASSTLGEL